MGRDDVGRLAELDRRLECARRAERGVGDGGDGLAAAQDEARGQLLDHGVGPANPVVDEVLLAVRSDGEFLRFHFTPIEPYDIDKSAEVQALQAAELDRGA